MINERSPLIRRTPNHQYDRFYPNPNPKLLPKHLASMDWTHAGEPSSTVCVQPSFNLLQKDWVPPLVPPPSSSPSSSAPAPVFSLSATDDTRGGYKFRSRVSEPTVAVPAGAMRDAYNRTRVVVRHMPPSLPESTFMEEITSRFGGTFNMASFCPGKSSTKSTTYSRAYIDFKHPEDVIEFYHGFNGHVFVNEKGTQYKALVEYAPYQRVPKLWVKKDPREGSILQDPEYLKFTELIAKPIEYLPSAEAQLEKKEAERNANQGVGTRDPIIVTPLMESVRDKRAKKSMPQKSLAAGGKINARGGGPSIAPSSKIVLKRGDRSRANSMFSSGPRPKEKATYVPRYDENHRRDTLADKKGRVMVESKDQKSFHNTVINRTDSINQDEQTNMNGSVTSGKKIIGLDKEESINGPASMNPGSLSDSKGGSHHAMRNRGISSMKSPAGSSPSQHEDDLLLSKPSPRSDGSAQHSRGSSSSRSPFLLQKPDQASDRDKRFSRSQMWKSSGRESNAPESELYSTEEKIEPPRQDARRVRNKDRPDRPVWTVRQRGDATESPKTSVVGPCVSPPGSQRQGRGPRDLEIPDASKPIGKRIAGSSVMYGHEKQVWVAKPGSGT